jgi:putative solute:sodium symporter small subunit
MKDWQAACHNVRNINVRGCNPPGDPMMPQQPHENRNSPDLHINFFRPRPGFMRREVTVICLTLLAWAVVSIGFPLCLGMTTTDPTALINGGRSVFGMPLHFWFSGHFLIFWFILISAIFNFMIDWITKSCRKRL